MKVQYSTPPHRGSLFCNKDNQHFWHQNELIYSKNKDVNRAEPSPSERLFSTTLASYFNSEQSDLSSTSLIKQLRFRNEPKLDRLRSKVVIFCYCLQLITGLDKDQLTKEIRTLQIHVLLYGPLGANVKLFCWRNFRIFVNKLVFVADELFQPSLKHSSLVHKLENYKKVLLHWPHMVTHWVALSLTLPKRQGEINASSL